MTRPPLSWAAGAALAVLTGAVARPPSSVHLDAGHVVGDLLRGPWDASDRTEVDQEVAALDASIRGPAHFRFRTATPGSAIDLPLRPREGEMSVRVRALARVRTAVTFHAGGQTTGEVTVPKAPWAVYDVAVRAADPGDAFPLVLALRPLPLVRVPDAYVAEPKLWISDIDVSSPSGLTFTPRARLLFGVVPLLVFAFARVVSIGTRAALASAVAAAGIVLALARVAPLPLYLAVPRLLLPALGAGLLTWLLLGRRREVSAPSRAGLAALVAAGVLVHAALPFVPGYDPYDVEVHVRRARDFSRVTFEYGSLLLYGSHLPTPTQTFGTATAALGDRILIPYPPLSYVAYYPLHKAGLDLHWTMTLVDTLLAMAVVPLLWLVAARAWNPGSAWVAVLLYALDLPIWHHVGRAHHPASFGGALGVMALLHLAHEAERLDTRPRIALATAVVALAILGYSSAIVLFGLFGATLLVLLATDAAGLTRAAKQGLVLSLVLGGLAAGVLFYFHYLPGLLHGTGMIQAEADPFPPRTFFVFHNESRQSMRVWAAGFAVPLVAAAVAAPFALRRALPSVRPVIAAWLLSWPVIMLAKEPFLFPRPMRWAKEDQFIAPALALVIGGAVFSLPRPWMRWTAAALAVGTALWIQTRDYYAHAAGLL